MGYSFNDHLKVTVRDKQQLLLQVTTEMFVQPINNPITVYYNHITRRCITQQQWRAIRLCPANTSFVDICSQIVHNKIIMLTWRHFREIAHNTVLESRGSDGPDLLVLLWVSFGSQKRGPKGLPDLHYRLTLCARHVTPLIRQNKKKTLK